MMVITVVTMTMTALMDRDFDMTKRINGDILLMGVVG
jgi:hypothetical protein